MCADVHYDFKSFIQGEKIESLETVSVIYCVVTKFSTLQYPLLHSFVHAQS